jgi:hypothetical protein
VANYIEDYRCHGNVERALNEVNKEIDLTLNLAGYSLEIKPGTVTKYLTHQILSI